MNKLNMDKYIKAQSILCDYKDYPNEVAGDDVSKSVSLFLQLIFEYEKLDRALDRAIDELYCNNNCPFDTRYQMCLRSEKHDRKKCWREYLMKGENINIIKCDLKVKNMIEKMLEKVSDER